MKNIFDTIAVAFSMYSSIPVPQLEWNSKNMRYALCALPLVGVVIGLMSFIWAYISITFKIPVLIKAAGLYLIPTLISGGIHLDGYADVYDALSSYAGPQRRQEIMKDPHCGAFAIIHVCVYFIAYFAVCGSIILNIQSALCISLIYIISRSAAGFAMTILPLAKNTGLAHAFTSASDKKKVRIILGLACILEIVILFVIDIYEGIGMTAAFILVSANYFITANKKFGGINGDLSGWFLIKTEFWMTASIIFVQILEANL